MSESGDPDTSGSWGWETPSAVEDRLPEYTALAPAENTRKITSVTVM